MKTPDPRPKFRDNGKYEVQPVQQRQRSRKGKSEPHHSVPKERLPLRLCHLERKLNNRITEFLVFNPLFPDDDIDAKHPEDKHKNKRGPP